MRRQLVAGASCVAVVLAACSGGGDKKATPTTGGGALSATPLPPTPTPGGATTTVTRTRAGAISIDAPVEGETVSMPLEIAGHANVFEGALVVQVIAGTNGVVCEHPVQTTGGTTGPPSAWSTTVAFSPDLVSPNGADPVTIRAFDFSAVDGSEQDVVTRQVRVSAEPPAIVIDSPGCNAVFGPTAAIEVTGTAQVFEAALIVELRNAGGDPFLQQRVLASTGTGRGTWTASFDLSQLPAGGGTYELVAYDLSARDGAVENEFSLPVTVMP